MSYWLFAIAIVFVMYAAISKRLSTSIVSGPMFFVTAGLLLGSETWGVIDVETGDTTAILLFEVTLAVVLFSDATAISGSNWREESTVPGRLLGWGLPLTIVLGLATAAALFTTLDFWEAALLGAILAPTDASLGQAVISNPRVPQRIRQGLNVESGLNDGIVLPIVLVFAGIAEETVTGGSLGGVLSFIGKEILIAAVVGVVIGWVGGRVLVGASRRQWISPMWLQIGALALAATAYGLAVALDGSGFIAAWLTGLALGATTRGKLEDFDEFAETLGSALTMISFLLFGAILLGPALGHLTWQIALYAVLSLTIIRMVPVAVSMIGSGLPPVSVLFVGWFGPRGLATIILAGIVIEETALPGTEIIVTVAMITVGLSVFAHGITSWYGSESFGAWWARTEDTDAVTAETGAATPTVRVPQRFRAPGLSTQKPDPPTTPETPK